MPQKMYMLISNNRHAIKPKAAVTTTPTNLANVAVHYGSKATQLNMPMIGRVHLSKGGCSSCGKR
jgi:hypothetical protein